MKKKTAAKAVRAPEREAPASTKLSPQAVESQIAGFIAKFDPKVAVLIRSCRKELRRQLPTAFELIYDNYNFFVIGFTSTQRASDCIVSLAASANGVALSFYHGASLKDPAGLLQGSGKQNRYIRLPRAEALRDASVVALIREAAAIAKTAPPRSGRGETIVKSISKKQRPRRKAT